MQSKIDTRNNLLITIYINQINKQIDSKLIQYIDLYLRINVQNQTFPALYKLLSIQKSINDDDLMTFQYLKSMIFQKADEQEQKKSRDYLNLDQILRIDELFVKYKNNVLQTSLTIERFWTEISKTDYIVMNLIALGNTIVEQYLQTKQIFESIIENQNDNEEAVVIHVKFLEKIMNFELESQYYSNLLNNIRQKLSIKKQSHYLQNQEQQAIILVSCLPTQTNKILYVNKTFYKTLGYNQAKDIQDRPLSAVIPREYADSHDKILDRFLNRIQFQSNFEKSQRRVWMLKKDLTILAGQIDTVLRISQKEDLVIQGIFNSSNEIITPNFTFNLKEAQILLCDEQGIIMNSSRSFIDKFIDTDFFSFDDARIFVHDVIIELSKFTDIELKEGVQAQMINKISCSQYKTKNMSENYLDIFLQQNIYNLPNKMIIKEYIILVQSDFQTNNKKRMTKKIFMDEEEKQIQK
ncbi:UNKNOWN [Stylonychia lemnae]|uniref:PAS domain-containing protein n=1 Tax=Stylonychia lemnae TaxID=5949 RepID=A0A078A5M9_STYLE|nr:UNKNOWN [Stylonychia lemnae]|eukprot:CDW77550.1 UNKNOWN [Stylonychia lemnae]